ncbi:hypothetical protein V2S66_23465 [Streptomyces sp. V4-01]|uniref:Integral membrane protein n=1 Tax=Actinacidiphila polyblastidii TaxID=3110430 RepID=A0ABU7PIK9_9ACTN|nr:hypothetical protein [Streptomyces sp. V4-01]
MAQEDTESAAPTPFTAKDHKQSSDEDSRWQLNDADAGVQAREPARWLWQSYGSALSGGGPGDGAGAGTRGPAAGSTSALGDGIKRAASNLLSEVLGLPERRTTLLATRSEGHAEGVESLTDLPSTRTALVRNRVRASYWSVNSQSSWFEALTDFLENNQVLVPLTFLPAAFAVLLPVLIFRTSVEHLFGRERFDLLLACTAIAAFGAPEVLAQAVSDTVLKKAVLWMRVTHVAALAGLLVWRDWAPPTERLARTSFARDQAGRGKRFDPSQLHAGAALTVALIVVISVVILLALAPLMLSAARRIGPAEPAAAVASGRMILELYQLALTAQEARKTWGAGHDDPVGPAGLELYIASRERRRLLTHLDRLSRLARGRWKRSLRAGDAAADYALAGLAEGISVAATRWKAKVSTANQDDLAAVSRHFTAALVDACEGNWGALAAEATAKELIGRRLLSWARRLVATVLMFLAVVVIAVQPAGWPSLTDNPVVGSLVLATAGALCLYIDPHLGERIGKATSLMNPFSEKK